MQNILKTSTSWNNLKTFKMIKHMPFLVLFVLTQNPKKKKPICLFNTAPLAPSIPSALAKIWHSYYTKAGSLFDILMFFMIKKLKKNTRNLPLCRKRRKETLGFVEWLLQDSLRGIQVIRHRKNRVKEILSGHPFMKDYFLFLEAYYI